MISICEQNLERKYFVPILSRGFFVSALCYLIAFIVPVLILVSIGYSWPSNQKYLIKPTVKYQNFQSFCLLLDQSTIYDSSFSDQSQRNYQTIVSAGSDKNLYSISVFVPGNVVSCTILTYNRVLVNDNTQVLVTIPFSFYDQSSTNAILNKVIQRGKLEVYSSSSLLDTTVTLLQTSYFQQSNDDFSIIDNSINYSSRNLSAFINVGTQKKLYGSANSVTFEGYFQVESQILIKAESLLNKIRSFVPFFMFLWFPLFFFLIVPLVQWMFANKLYFSKTEKSKIKLE